MHKAESFKKEHQENSETFAHGKHEKHNEVNPEKNFRSGVPLFLQRSTFHVGAQDDDYEQEAEQVAETVMRMPETLQEESFDTIDVLPERDAGMIRRYPHDRLDAGMERTDETHQDAGPGQRIDSGTVEDELRLFMSQIYSTNSEYPEGFRPSSGRGAFNARYDPIAGRLNISVTILFHFRNPVGILRGNPDCEWQPQEKEAFMLNACGMIEAAWSQQYRFHCTREFWEDLPDVDVIVNINSIQSNENEHYMSNRSAHYIFTISKHPERRLGEPYAAGAGDLGTGRRPFGTVNMRESMEGGIENPDDLERVYYPTLPEFEDVEDTNPGRLYFEPGSDELSVESQRQLEGFSGVLGQHTIPPFPVEVTGYSSINEGQEYPGLSDRRAEAVASVISMVRSPSLCEAYGVDGIGEGARSRYAEIEIQPFRLRQCALLHEFGHIIGLGDEYPGPAPAPDRGEESTHSDLAETLIPGQQPIITVESENIMSVGEVVQPWHYVTFMEALGVISDTEGEWEIGPGPRAGSAQGEPGSQE